jgi:glycosyltransferase involved in cell wall biosynthesis
MPIGNRFFLNFAASYSGGGYKRLQAYADWFNRHGGAWFAIHPLCRPLMEQFPNNRYFPIARSRLTRLIDDWSYLREIGTSIGRPDLYYSYGIPLYVPFGRINWFHVSNVLPLSTAGIPLSWPDRCKFHLLGRRIRHGFALADIISAESRSSLRLIDPRACPKMLVSVNGSDDELQSMRESNTRPKENIAVVLGTYRYKALEESWHVFRLLRSANPGLRLVIIGNDHSIPRALQRDRDVDIRGELPRAAVNECLRRCRFYISTTHTENSYNAASEAIFLADESYISDIGPHRELIGASPHRRIAFSGLTRPLLHVQRGDLSSTALKSWDTVISEMTVTTRQLLASGSSPELQTSTRQRCVPATHPPTPAATTAARALSVKHPRSMNRTGG